MPSKFLSRVTASVVIDPGQIGSTPQLIIRWLFLLTFAIRDQKNYVFYAWGSKWPPRYTCSWAWNLIIFVSFLMFYGSGNSLQLLQNAWPSRMTLKFKVTWFFRCISVSSHAILNICFQKFKATWLCTWPYLSQLEQPFLFVYILLSSLYQITIENKKLRCSNRYSSRDRYGHVKNHVTLNFKVFRQGQAFVSSWSEFPDP